MSEVDLERRRAPRASVNVPIQLSPGGDAVPAQLKDLSTSGLCCQFGEAMSEMTLVGIELELGNEHAHVQGAVVRCDKVRGVNPPTYEIGIYFTEMSGETRKSLHAFLDSQLDSA